MVILNNKLAYKVSAGNKAQTPHYYSIQTIILMLSSVASTAYTVSVSALQES